MAGDLLRSLGKYYTAACCKNENIFVIVIMGPHQAFFCYMTLTIDLWSVPMTVNPSFGTKQPRSLQAHFGSTQLKLPYHEISVICHNDPTDNKNFVSATIKYRLDWISYDGHKGSETAIDT